LRPEESAYWDEVAFKIKERGKGELNDNIWKRCEIVSRILSHRPIGAAILEIGVGQSLGAATVNLVTLGNMRYVGTDVSPRFCEFTKKRWRLEVVQTDVTHLPDGPFDMIWAFDTLEHVRPEDRPSGFQEMGRVLGKNGLILLNIPLNESAHDEEFDWGFTERDVIDLKDATHTRINKWEAYDVPEISKSYLWVELAR